MWYNPSKHISLANVRFNTERSYNILEYESIILAAIAMVGTIIGGLLVYKREREKVQLEHKDELSRMNSELFTELSRQTAEINERVREDMSVLSDKNAALSEEIEKITGEVGSLKLNFISISRQYAIMRAKVTELSKIATKLIEQIESDGNVPVFDSETIEELVSGAGEAQDEICVACLTNILAGGKMNEDEIRDAIITTTPKETNV